MSRVRVITHVKIPYIALDTAELGLLAHEQEMAVVADVADYPAFHPT